MRKCISKWIHNYQDIHKYATAMFDYQRLKGTSFVHWSSTVTYPCWWFDGDYTPQHIGEWFDLDLVKLCFFTGWWFQTFFIFHNIWDVILPIDFHIFQDGYCTTNQFIMITFHNIFEITRRYNEWFAVASKQLSFFCQSGEAGYFFDFRAVNDDNLASIWRDVMGI